MKKVLFTATVDSHILHFHLPFLKYFKENGYEVHVATNGNEEIPYCDKKHIVTFERSPLKTNNLKAIKQLKKIIDEEKFELIHTHTPMGAVVTRLAARKARKNGTRVLYTAHGFHFFKGASIKHWAIFYPVEKFLARYTDTLITINLEDYELAKNKFKKCKDIKYVPGVGIDPEKFNFKFSDKEKKELRESLGLKEDDFVLIYPAEISNRKRQVWLINTLKELLNKNKKIHLLLPGKDSLDGICQKLVGELKLDKQIHFLGYRKDIPKLLKISNLAVSSANQEGLPVNIMEAMYIGLPIVASDCRGNRDLVINNENGFLCALDDSKAFVDGIEKLANDKELYENQSIRNKEMVKDYTLDKIMKDMKEIYFPKAIYLIIPTCTDLNRGDQALTIETKHIIDVLNPNNETYMLANGDTTQCEKYGLRVFNDILKHPSRIGKKKKNVKYNLSLKIRWGAVALVDFFCSILLLNGFTRKIAYCFLSKNTKRSLQLYEKSKAIFVKGGGFLHDYSKGLIGIYTTYYQIFHIWLAIRMKKKVFVMPNSFGPFRNKVTKKMVNHVLNKCVFISARESISANEDKNGLSRDIPLYPDLAFYLDASKITSDIKVEKDTIAITVRPYRFYGSKNPEERYLNYKHCFVEFIEYLEENNYNVLLVVHTRAENSHEDDESCINEIYAMLKNKKRVKILKNDNLDCYDLKKLYGKCKYTIGTRFHSVIFSLEQKVPCIAITYGGNKGNGIMHDMDLDDYAIKIDELTSERLKSQFENLKKDEKEYLKKVNKYLEYANQKREELIEIVRKDGGII